MSPGDAAWKRRKRGFETAFPRRFEAPSHPPDLTQRTAGPADDDRAARIFRVARMIWAWTGYVVMAAALFALLYLSAILTGYRSALACAACGLGITLPRPGPAQVAALGGWGLALRALAGALLLVASWSRPGRVLVATG